MAIGATAVWEARTTATAANVNGGFYTSGGTDYSQQNAAQYALTNGAVTSGSAVYTHASAAADMVGNGMKIVSGTNATVGWYEVISVVVGVSITLDRSVATGTGSNVAANIGGAMSLASSDDAVFEAMVSGNKMYVKTGTYTIGGTVSISTAAATKLPIVIEGYNAARGDRPTGSTRPVFACGAAIFTLNANWDVYSLQFTGTADPVLVSVGPTKYVGLRIINDSTTAGRFALQTGANAFVHNCETVSYRGIAMKATGSTQVIGCYIHDSDIGVSVTVGTGSQVFLNNIFADNVANGLKFSSATVTVVSLICGNTFYGAENKLGVGLLYPNTSVNERIVNNIFYGFVTGVTNAEAGQGISYDDFNNYYNNTTDNTNWAKGPNDLALNPAFASVAQITGATATTSGSVLTQAGADFSTVTDNVDFCYLISGTGITAGKYLITAHSGTTLTLNSAPGTSATADKVFQVTTGHNFKIGAALRGLASPGLFPGALTQNYLDVGAVQRREFITTGHSAIGG